MAVDYNPFSDQCRAQPFDHYRRLRAEAPVHWVPEARAYVVSRYDDVAHVLKHPELFSSDAMGGMLTGSEFEPPAEAQQSRIVILMDPPKHGSFRNLVNRGFTPRRIAMLEPRLDEIVRDVMAVIRNRQRFDLIEEVGVVVPLKIIAEMLGVETHRMDDFREWSTEIVRGATGSGRGAGLKQNPAFMGAVMHLFAYLGEIIERRAQAPQDDLITTLLAGEGGEAGLTREEIGGFALVLLVAGNETTTNLIGSLIKLLYEHPDQYERVRRDRSLIPNLIEETLRLEAPVQFLFRRATQDVEIAGTKIPKDSAVMPLLASANRDERQFAEPDRFDVTRDARGHLTFGLGIHFCLGAALARLEARVLLESLIDELPHWKICPGSEQSVDSYMMRGLRQLEMERVR